MIRLKQKENRDNVFQMLIASMLSIVVCTVCLVGGTFAWFTANENVPISAITSARYAITVSIVGEDYTEGQPEGNMCFYTLAPNNRYTITLSQAEDSTASTGYCLVAVDDQVYYTSPITAETDFIFTYQTGLVIPEGLTSVQFRELIDDGDNTDLTIGWYWGTYPDTQDLVAFEADPGYALLENGAILGTAPVEAPLDAELTLELNGFDMSDEIEKVIPLCEDYSLLLRPNEDYELPEYILIEIDGNNHEVYTDGSEHREIPLNEYNEPDITLLPPMPVFDPDTDTLTIPAALLTEKTQSVTISASAEKIEEPKCICETKCTELNGNCPICKEHTEGCIGRVMEETETESTETTNHTESVPPVGQNESVDTQVQEPSVEQNTPVNPQMPSEAVGQPDAETSSEQTEASNTETPLEPTEASNTETPLESTETSNTETPSEQTGVLNTETTLVPEDSKPMDEEITEETEKVIKSTDSEETTELPEIEE